MKLQSKHLLLLATVSCAALLSGCSMFKQGPERQGTKVEGERHPPVLNQKMMSGGRVVTQNSAPSAPIVPSYPAPVATAAAPVSNMETNPYDNFDDEGNMKQEMPGTVTASDDQSVDAGFFDRLFSSSKSEPAPAAKSIRKPVDSNPYYQAVPATPVTVSSYEPPAPSSHITPQTSASAFVPGTEPRSLSVPSQTSDTLPAPVEMGEAPQEKPSFVSRVYNHWNKPAESNAEQANAAYVPVGSVPAKPERLSELQQESPQQVQQMQTDNAVAQEEKQVLDSEPSEQTAAQVNVPTVDAAGQPVAAPVPTAPMAVAQPQEEREEQQSSGPISTTPSTYGRLPSPLLLQQKKAVLSSAN